MQVQNNSRSLRDDKQKGQTTARAGEEKGYSPTHVAMRLRHEWGTRAVGAGTGAETTVKCGADDSLVWWKPMSQNRDMGHPVEVVSV